MKTSIITTILALIFSPEILCANNSGDIEEGDKSKAGKNNRTSALKGRWLDQKMGVLGFGKVITMEERYKDLDFPSDPTHYLIRRNLWNCADEIPIGKLQQNNFGTLEYPDNSFTAVVVGPKAILTAAHSIDHQRIIEVLYANKAYCDWPSEFNNGSCKMDIALCRTQQELNLDKYERINIDSAVSANQVTSVGFGCPEDDALCIKESEVCGSPFDKDEECIHLSKCLCQGDSGGPVFFEADFEFRTILAVISRQCPEDEVEICNDHNVAHRHAVLTSTVKARKWIEGWASGDHQTPHEDFPHGKMFVCGVSKEETNPVAYKKCRKTPAISPPGPP